MKADEAVCGKFQEESSLQSRSIEDKSIAGFMSRDAFQVYYLRFVTLGEIKLISWSFYFPGTFTNPSLIDNRSPNNIKIRKLHKIDTKPKEKKN